MNTCDVNMPVRRRNTQESNLRDNCLHNSELSKSIQSDCNRMSLQYFAFQWNFLDINFFVCLQVVLGKRLNNKRLIGCNEIAYSNHNKIFVEPYSRAIHVKPYIQYSQFIERNWNQYHIITLIWSFFIYYEHVTKILYRIIYDTISMKIRIFNRAGKKSHQYFTHFLGKIGITHFSEAFHSFQQQKKMSLNLNWHWVEIVSCRSRTANHDISEHFSDDTWYK